MEVAAGGHVRVPVVQREEDFLVVCAGVILRLDIEAAELPRVSTALQVVSRKAVCVVPAESRRLAA